MTTKAGALNVARPVYCRRPFKCSSYLPKDCTYTGTPSQTEPIELVRQFLPKRKHQNPSFQDQELTLVIEDLVTDRVVILLSTRRGEEKTIEEFNSRAKPIVCYAHFYDPHPRGTWNFRVSVLGSTTMTMIALIFIGWGKGMGERKTQRKERKKERKGSEAEGGQAGSKGEKRVEERNLVR